MSPCPAEQRIEEAAGLTRSRTADTAIRRQRTPPRVRPDRYSGTGGGDQRPTPTALGSPDGDFGIDGQGPGCRGFAPGYGRRWNRRSDRAGAQQPSDGRLLGVQIKAGPSWFREPTPAGDGWMFREDTQTHRVYWLNYELPVIVMFYDPEGHIAYWQHVTPETAVVTGKGFKIVILSQQRLDAFARAVLAKLAREVPPDGLSEFLDQLPASCATRLRFWDEINPIGARRLATDLVAGRDRPAETVSAVTGEWPADQSWLVCMEVGEYAREYGLPAVAGKCFLAADRVGGDNAPSLRLRAFAGLLLSDSDPDRARNLLSECSSFPETRLLAAIGLAQLDHGGSTDPIPVPPEVEADPEVAASEPHRPMVSGRAAAARRRLGHGRQPLLVSLHPTWVRIGRRP